MSRASLFHRLLPDGRLHLQEGPIDLIVEAFGAAEEVRRAYAAAATCFEDVLPGLVAELPALKQPVTGVSPVVQGPVARRMATACRPHSTVFVTPMAAVAGAVADHVLAAMTAAAELARAYVNDGGDIALHLAPGESLACGMVARLHDPRLDGRAMVASEMPVRGIATSGRATQGQGGRSFSLGIADAVTVFARSAAEADVAATLAANAVDLPGHPAVRRQPACEIDPESDLGERLVTVGVGALAPEEVVAALTRGRLEAESMRAAGLIEAAVLFLDGQAEVVGGAIPQLSPSGLTRGSRTSDGAVALDARVEPGHDSLYSVASLNIGRQAPLTQLRPTGPRVARPEDKLTLALRARQGCATLSHGGEGRVMGGLARRLPLRQLSPSALSRGSRASDRAVALDPGSRSQARLAGMTVRVEDGDV